MNAVLFVCTANICRSPMAAGLLKRLVAGNQENWRIESAGVRAIDGSEAVWGTQAVLQARGIDIRDHRSRQITRVMLAEFPLVLVMEHGHKEGLRAAFPEFADRIFLLSEMIGKKKEIIDPMGGALVDYVETANEIEAILAAGMDTIVAYSQTTYTSSID